MSGTSLQYLKDKFSKEIARISGYMSEGNIKDFNDYKALCGEIWGLQKAIMEVDALERKMNVDDVDGALVS